MEGKREPSVFIKGVRKLFPFFLGLWALGGVHYFWSWRAFHLLGKAEVLWFSTRIPTGEETYVTLSKEVAFPEGEPPTMLHIWSQTPFQVYIHDMRLGQGDKGLYSFPLDTLPLRKAFRLVIAVYSSDGKGGVLASMDFPRSGRGYKGTDDSWSMWVNGKATPPLSLGSPWSLGQTSLPSPTKCNLFPTYASQVLMGERQGNRWSLPQKEKGYLRVYLTKKAELLLHGERRVVYPFTPLPFWMSFQPMVIQSLAIPPGVNRIELVRLTGSGY